MDEKKCKVKFIPEAVEDYKKLDGSVKKDVNKKIDRLSRNPLCGLPLGNKNNVDLTGFYKLYACGTSIRIVYRLLTPEKVEIVEIWGVGKRENLQIYKTVAARKKPKPNAAPQDAPQE